jgi:hypothetical protein
VNAQQGEHDGRRKNPKTEKIAPASLDSRVRESERGSSVGESSEDLEQHLLRNFRKYGHREVARGDLIVALDFVTSSLSSSYEQGVDMPLRAAKGPVRAEMFRGCIGVAGETGAFIEG